MIALDNYAAYWLGESPQPELRCPLSLDQFRHSSTSRERSTLGRMRDGLARGAIAYDRGGADGHFTASAAIIDPVARKTLLTHHRKLGIWVQLGGHCDGETDLVATSRREGLEESGLSRLVSWQPPVLASLGAVPLDLDIHSIPGPNGQHDHYHFDVRYLWLADASIPLVCSAESLDLAWVPFDQLRAYTTCPSVGILIEKAQLWLRDGQLATTRRESGLEGSL